MAFLHQLKTVILLGVLTGLVLFAGQLLGGMQGLLFALVFTVLMNFGMYFWSHKFVLFVHRAFPAKKSDYKLLHEIVEDVAVLAGIPKPHVYIIPSRAPNAFATGRNPKNAVVACTEGILDLLSKDELKGVIAHEISHVKNKDMLVATIAATLAGIISYAAYVAQWGLLFGRGERDDSGNALGALILIILTPIIAMILQLAITRSREYLADESGARTVKNVRGLASALQKIESGVHHHTLTNSSNPAMNALFIVNPLRANIFTTLFSTHPPTAERVKRLHGLKI